MSALARVTFPELRPAVAGVVSHGASADSSCDLTLREREVLQLLCEGRSTKVIARVAGLSGHTVKWYIRRFAAKFGVTNRTQVVSVAVYWGLADPGALAGSRPRGLTRPQ